ncbi:MAG: hypothetical protein LBB35_00245, partial [Coriobacteriaceae bacterium]|nr:hypothetical protein [Coriobacteriaceae bacterium]
NEDKRYEAYNAFMLLGDYSDAAARAQACIVPITSSKEVYRNPDFSIMACDFTITSNSSTALTFLKIYNGDTLVSSLFITPGSSLRITLPVNTYKIRAAVGENWFGDSDLFGDDGYYYQMEFDDSGTDTMVFETNYSYTLDLQVSEGGNVSSKDLDWDTF